jgi:hypothetical protein
MEKEKKKPKSDNLPHATQFTPFLLFCCSFSFVDPRKVGPVVWCDVVRCETNPFLAFFPLHLLASLARCELACMHRRQ